MQKRNRVDQLVLGMHLKAFCGTDFRTTKRGGKANQQVFNDAHRQSVLFDKIVFEDRARDA
jgi:hypothetical protein